MKKSSLAIALAVIVFAASYAYCQTSEENEGLQKVIADQDEVLAERTANRQAASYENDLMMTKEKARVEKIDREATTESAW